MKRVESSTVFDSHQIFNWQLNAAQIGSQTRKTIDCWLEINRNDTHDTSTKWTFVESIFFCAYWEWCKNHRNVTFSMEIRRQRPNGELLHIHLNLLHLPMLWTKCAKHIKSSSVCVVQELNHFHFRGIPLIRQQSHTDGVNAIFQTVRKKKQHWL